MDVLNDFITEWCVEGKELFVHSVMLYDVYLIWCQENSENYLEKNDFGSKLREKGFIKKAKRFPSEASKKTNRKQSWIGLDLQEEYKDLLKNSADGGVQV